ncbi:hypothetical protein [Methylobacterium sp. Leaf108]|uniref:hypothetical protein n=1 Tax=Methylobacterium sp. Leaf108 TaxID=1736256 RepID=UPI001AEBAC18|nr:hypothetical protein [Methylobacterium sp. Leaf108]
MTRIPLWSHRIGLMLAGPVMLFAFVLAGMATWEARPLPACGAGGIDMLNPALRCRRMTMIRGMPVSPQEAAGVPGMQMIEQGTVSGMPDLRPAGLAALCGLLLYGVSRIVGQALHRRRTEPMEVARQAVLRQRVASSRHALAPKRER